MICLYNSMTTDFTKNGLVILSDCKSFFTTEDLNGKYEIEFEYPLDDRGKWQYILEGNIVKNSDGQLFRIYHKVKTFSGVKANARHIYYDLLDNFIETITLTNVSGSSALNSILTNTQYAHIFLNMSDLTAMGNLTISKTNPVDAIMGKDSLITTYGGELVRDNYTIKLLQARGLDRGVLISYGKNILGIEETIDLDSIITRIYPTGKDGLTLPEKYIDSQYINNYPHPKVKEIQFTDIDNVTNLRTAAQNYFTSSKCDIPLTNYVIDFIELSKTEEYKNYSILETVYMGDTVTVRHSKLNIDLKCKVISIKKNDLTGRISKVELGSFKPNIATGINKSIQTVKAEIVETKSSLQTAIDNATTQINSALGGYVVKRNGELLNMDTEDPMTATKVWRWNQGGLGYSGTGYNGPYRTAITADGHIVADFIDTGTLNAALINVQGLVVGNNVTMGPNATISYSKVTDQPTIPTTAAQVGAKPYDWLPSYGDITGVKPPSNADNTATIVGNKLTYIDSNGIYTGTLTAQQINAIQGIVLGADATIQWASIADKPTIPTTAAQVGALATNWVGTTYINANGVYTGTIVANQITSGVISGDRISGGTITGTTLSGVTIAGANITASDSVTIQSTIQNGTISAGLYFGNVVAGYGGRSSIYGYQYTDGSTCLALKASTFIQIIAENRIDLMKASGQGVAVATGNITAAGNVTANNFIGNIAGAYVTGYVSGANYAVNAGTATYASHFQNSVSGLANNCTLNTGGGTIRLVNSSGAYLSISGNSLGFYDSYGGYHAIV